MEKSGPSPIEQIVSSFHEFRSRGNAPEVGYAEILAETEKLMGASGLWAGSAEGTQSFQSHGPVVGVFVDECRPAPDEHQVDGDLRYLDGIWLAIIGTLIFFYLDDLTDEAREGNADGIRRALEVGHEEAGLELFLAFREVLLGFPRGEVVCRAFVDLLDGMLKEARRKAERPEVGFSVGDYEEIRSDVVFVRQYQEIWSCGERLDFPPGFGPLAKRLDALASRIIAGVNDLASLDTEDSFALNKVYSLINPKVSESDAVDRVSQEHNDDADEYVELAHCVLKEFPDSAHVARFVDQSASTIRGNLRASLRLRGERYPHASKRLERCRTHQLYVEGQPHPVANGARGGASR